MLAGIADIVRAEAGRDKGKYFLVVGRDTEWIFLADGKTRRAEKPKRKKLKHIRPIAPAIGTAALKLKKGEPVTNSEIRRAITEYRKLTGTVPSKEDTPAGQLG